MTAQLLLVVIFIVFEEVVWEGIAKPIYLFVHELQLLQKIQRKLQSVNRYLLLVIFITLLVGVELAGVTAGIMAVKGMVWSAMLLYGLKIPIAAFTFWLFHVTEKKLLSFEWFRYLYEQTVALFAWIKHREIYQETTALMQRIKTRTKAWTERFKREYLTGDKRLSRRFKRLYRFVKRIVRRS